MNSLAMLDFNTKVFYFINSGAGYYTWLDTFVIFLTTYLVQIVFVVVGVYFFIWLPFVITKASVRRLHLLAQAAEMAIALCTTWIVVKVIKFVVAHPRPFETLLDSNLLVVIKGGDSFPSGHSALSFALATTIYLHHKRLGILLFGFAILVAYSRMYVGVHYPLDVFAGMLLGMLIPYAFHRLFVRR